MAPSHPWKRPLLVRNPTSINATCIARRDGATSGGLKAPGPLRVRSTDKAQSGTEGGVKAGVKRGPPVDHPPSGRCTHGGSTWQRHKSCTQALRCGGRSPGDAGHIASQEYGVRLGDAGGTSPVAARFGETSARPIGDNAFRMFPIGPPEVATRLCHRVGRASAEVCGPLCKSDLVSTRRFLGDIQTRRGRSESLRSACTWERAPRRTRLRQPGRPRILRFNT